MEPINRTDTWRIHARAQHREGHSQERVWSNASQEPSVARPRSQVSRLSTQGRTSTTPYPPTSQASQSAQLTPLRESLDRSHQRGFETFQASYGPPSRCNPNLLHLFCLSLSLLVFGRLPLVPHPGDCKPATPFAYCTVPNPRLRVVVLQFSVMPSYRCSIPMRIE